MLRALSLEGLLGILCFTEREGDTESQAAYRLCALTCLSNNYSFPGNLFLMFVWDVFTVVFVCLFLFVILNRITVMVLLWLSL